ncbi:heparanase-like [Diorhabda sublineata]|uniref:heparanase-like n=1 Tax=Diorhabda sublineata TaxID=1163346 RepID=UPI0024E09073|nr:heparanase-like [Diorhabda sublineata]
MCNYKYISIRKRSEVIQFCSLIVVILTFIYGVFHSLLTFNTEDQVQTIFIYNSKAAKFKTSSKFLSIALDDAVIAENFKHFDMTNEKLIKMVKHLSPAFFRVGGSGGDKLTFSLNNKTSEIIENVHSEEVVDCENPPNITLSAHNWLKLTNFSKQTFTDLFFGLNALQRFQNGSWDYRNAELMIQFSNENKLIVNWELGNEPNSFKHKFNQEVNASQLAEDFKTLRSILNKNQYKESLLVGPDVTRPQDNHKESEIYLEEFVKNIGSSINKITWHQYYLNGKTAQPKDFLDPDIFDLLKYQINKVREITIMSNRSIWLGETSSAYGSGAPNLSDTFIGTFIWLDKLGLAAKMGIEVVMRQSIFKGHYALLDENYDPNPDWWISLIYKKLVGGNVVPYYSISNDKVRLYVHCLKNEKIKSIVIFGSNVDKIPAKVRIEGLLVNNSSPLKYIYAFQLQSTNLFSKEVYLNGKILKMLPGYELPKILPKRESITPYIIIPPYSLVFWVTPEINIKAC